MARYLTFALVAPLASFGGIAVGERRSGWDRPARSAVLGLVGACLGVERDDAEGQAALADDYGIALLCSAPGRLLVDYHTTQVPPRQRGRRFATRAQELSAPGLNTILSRRDYRNGAWHVAGLWERSGRPRWSLEVIAESMRRPGFVPYLGRKSCPLGFPLAPDICDAADAPAALLMRQATGPEVLLASRGKSVRERLAGLAAEGESVIAMDAPDGTLRPGDAGYVAPDDPRRRYVERRRDQPRSRARWQFDLRAELVMGVLPAPGAAR